MQPELVFHILRTRFWLIGLCVAAVMFVTLLVSANFKPSYEATASIVLELPAGGPLNTTGQPRQLGGDYMMTQVDVLLSRKVALRALQQMDDAMLKLAHDESGAAGNYIPGEFPETLFAYVSEQLEAKPSRDSRVINVTFSGQNPRLAQALTNAIAQAFLDVATEMRVDPVRRRAAWFEQHLDELRKEVETRQVALADFQNEAGIGDQNERFDTANIRLEQLASRLLQAQTELQSMISRQLGERHPEYVRAVEQLRAIEQAHADQQQKLVGMREDRAKLTLLVQELETARTTYQASLDKYYETQLESQFNQSTGAILSYAQLPEAAERNLMLILILGLVLGAAVGAMLALLLEQMDRRVHVVSDLEKQIGLQVLARV